MCSQKETWPWESILSENGMPFHLEVSRVLVELQNNQLNTTLPRLLNQTQDGSVLFLAFLRRSSKKTRQNTPLEYPSSKTTITTLIRISTFCWNPSPEMPRWEIRTSLGWRSLMTMVSAVSGHETITISHSGCMLECCDTLFCWKDISFPCHGKTGLVLCGLVLFFSIPKEISPKVLFICNCRARRIPVQGIAVLCWPQNWSNHCWGRETERLWWNCYSGILHDVS